MPGLVIVDKPAGLTSHDVVARLRRVLGTRKIGHAGTLDPMATGVLVCGVGRGTKLLGHLALDTKAYTATIRLGVATTTDDAEGEILVDRRRRPGSTDAAVAAGMAALTGAIEQVPSSVSAIKVDGQRAYARVRAGEQVVLPARPVTVSAFTLLARRAVGRPRRPRRRRRVLLRHLRAGAGPRPRRRARRRRAPHGAAPHPGRPVHPGPRPHPGASWPPSRACRCRSTRPSRWPSRAATSTPRWPSDLSHGRPLPAAGLAGTYGVFAPDGRALALVTRARWRRPGARGARPRGHLRSTPGAGPGVSVGSARAALAWARGRADRLGAQRRHRRRVRRGAPRPPAADRPGGAARAGSAGCRRCW